MPERGPHEIRNALFQQVAALESGMAQMQALFLKERQRLYSKINSLSPIDQLPAEIKTEIFHKALLNDRTDKENNPVVTPFFLGKICQSWREFVWSTPILWTNIHLCLSEDRCKAQTNLLRDWLSRTAKYPLSFRLTTEDSERDFIPDPLIRILIIFASVSAQWKEIEFFLPDRKDCFDAISAAEKSLPLLTKATAHLNSSDRQLKLFSTAPQLSVLHLYDAYLFKMPAPWHQLLEFTSQAFTVDEVRELLNKVPNIIRCSFRGIVPMIFHDSRDLGIFHQLPVLEYLEYLELWFDQSIHTESTQILGSAKIPSLREVSLGGPFADSPVRLSAITTSFYSSHLLEKFTFHGTITSDHDLIRVLENLPSIKDLRLDFHEQLPNHKLLTKTFLQRLYPPHTHILLPNLRSFTYDGPTALDNHLSVFRDALVYRFRQCALQHTGLDAEQKTVCQIQSVIVTSSSELFISPDIQEELDSLVREGLELSLTSIVPDF